ncbi:hypothetical protein D3C72_2320970 [compost metagenome]
MRYANVLTHAPLEALWDVSVNSSKHIQELWAEHVAVDGEDLFVGLNNLAEALEDNLDVRFIHSVAVEK